MEEIEHNEDEFLAPVDPPALPDLTEAEPAPAASAEGPRTAAEKILETMDALSRPGEDAGEMGLMISTVCMGLGSKIGPELGQAQQTGELDEFVLALTRWIASHRSENQRQLLVVEMPRRPDLPPGTRLHLMDQALEAAANVESPL